MERTSLVRAKIALYSDGGNCETLIKDGGKLGVSSRGMGSLENKGGANYVKDDFYLATVRYCCRPFCTSFR